MIEIFWVRRLPDNMVVVHGRGLSTNRQAASPKASIDGVAVKQILDNTADGTPALEEVQLYESVPGSTFTLIKENGETASAPIQSAYTPTAGTLLPSSSAKYKINAGVFDNVTIEIPRSRTASAALEIDQTGPLHIKNLNIVNKSSNGIGINIIKCFDATFENVNIISEQPVYAAPNAKHGRNNFLYSDMSSPHPQYGQINRGLLGEENFVGWTKWHHIDRGPVGQMSGPPMYRSLLYRCQQEFMGTTIGGSEGILWEAPNGWPVSANCTGSTLTFAGNNIDVRVGVFACDLLNKKWARITNFTTTTVSGIKSYTVTLDRVMNTGQRDWFVGNCIVENTVVNSTFNSCKLGVHLFGRSIGNVFKLWDCRNVHDVVVEEIMTAEQARNVYGFAWSNIYNRLRWTGGSRGVYRTKKYYDGMLSPQQQLPWFGYAEDNEVLYV